MTISKPGRDSDQFALRLPDGMRDRIKAAADANNRSMNAEIVATLREAYPEPEPDDDIKKILDFIDALPSEDRNRFLEDYMDYYVSKHGSQDIEDGLIPGVVMRKE